MCLGGDVVQGARYELFIIEERDYDRDQWFYAPVVFSRLDKRIMFSYKHSPLLRSLFWVSFRPKTALLTAIGKTSGAG
jgi:hypothetical protein